MHYIVEVKRILKLSRLDFMYSAILLEKLPDILKQIKRKLQF